MFRCCFVINVYKDMFQNCLFFLLFYWLLMLFMNVIKGYNDYDKLYFEEFFFFLIYFKCLVSMCE